MANFEPPNIDDHRPIQGCDTENTSTDQNVSNNRRNKRILTLEESRQLTDKLLEIEQIKCEERLIHEQINHLNIKKQYLQYLLTIIRTMDTNDAMRNSSYRNRPRQKVFSKPRST